MLPSNPDIRFYIFDVTSHCLTMRGPTRKKVVISSADGSRIKVQTVKIPFSKLASHPDVEIGASERKHFCRILEHKFAL